MKIELKCGRDDCELVTTDKDECTWCIETERAHYNATIERLEAELAKSRTYCDETFGKLNERNILIVDLEAERDEAIKEIGKQARGRGYAEQERDEANEKAKMWQDKTTEKVQQLRECYGQRDSARKTASERYDVINKQAATILSMRNCGNCADANDGECRHFYNFDCQQGDSAKKTYLVKWEIKK